tara:strand:+ start:582 stop:746 length:165 start_codon:yes stop_codon:yes gene_type:complete
LLDRPENSGKIEVKAMVGRRNIERDFMIEFVMITLFLSPLLYVVCHAVVDMMRV